MFGSPTGSPHISGVLIYILPCKLIPLGIFLKFLFRFDVHISLPIILTALFPCSSPKWTAGRGEAGKGQVTYYGAGTYESASV